MYAAEVCAAGRESVSGDLATVIDCIRFDQKKIRAARNKCVQVEHLPVLPQSRSYRVAVACRRITGNLTSRIHHERLTEAIAWQCPKVCNHSATPNGGVER